MGDMRNFASDSSSRAVSIDPYALVEAIMGSQRQASVTQSVSDGLQGDYDELADMRDDNDNNDGKGPRPDSPPKNICVGAANPYAVVEALLGRKIDKSNINVSQILSNVLQTDYDELFDMKHQSVLYAGMRLNDKERRAERLSEKDVKILNERDLITPDLSRVQRLGDLEKIGLKDVDDTRVKVCRMQNGKLRLVLHAHQLGRTVTNRDVTMSINELCTPYRREKGGEWRLPNGTWRDMYDYFFRIFNRRLVEDINMFHIGDNHHGIMGNWGQFARSMGQGTSYHHFDDPTQGCSTNSWFVAALFSVFWANPCAINRDTRLFGCQGDRDCGRDSDDDERRDGHHDRDGHHGNNGGRKRLAIKFHDKGGDNNNKTQTVEVNYEIPMNNSNNQPLFCRSSDGADIWPCLYEKAFAKWVTGTRSDQPDITQTHCGDPIKAMAQLNGREPHYFSCDRHSAHDLLGLVRANCVSLKTINPMAAFTHATGEMYRGANIVANHAYSVLGYAILGDRQYVVLRNPWGVTEPQGLTSYPGLLGRVEPELWQPAALLDHGGLFALEPEAFKRTFAYVGVAK